MKSKISEIEKKGRDKLFIIGNGFDLAHNMPTGYVCFREYLSRKTKEHNLMLNIPQKRYLPDGRYGYAENDIVGFILNVIDECQDERWSGLESLLGEDALYEQIGNKHGAYAIQVLDESDETVNAFALSGALLDSIAPEILSPERFVEDASELFSVVNKYYCEWVHEFLGFLDYSNYPRCKVIDDVLDREGFYLNFNYTYTLENIYNISLERVCHIHGNVSSCDEDIYFGHGSDFAIDKNEDENDFDIYDDKFVTPKDFIELKRFLKKDIERAIRDNYDFFEKLQNVTEIFSYGFSFSDVDMRYVEEICKHVQPHNVRWHFNRYDIDMNPRFLDIIKRKGFIVDDKEESLW